MNNWQTVAAIAIAALAAVWAGWMLLASCRAIFRPGKRDRCSGDCGCCGHKAADSATQPGTGDSES